MVRRQISSGVKVAGTVVGAAAGAVAAVVDTFVAVQNFQQRDTASVCRETMADSGGDRIAQISRFSPPEEPLEVQDTSYFAHRLIYAVFPPERVPFARFLYCSKSLS